MGRPLKLTSDVEGRICEALRGGAPRKLAAERAGISRTTLHRWETRGADPAAPPRFQNFARAVAAARRERAAAAAE